MSVLIIKGIGQSHMGNLPIKERGEYIYIYIYIYIYTMLLPTYIRVYEMYNYNSYT